MCDADSMSGLQSPHSASAAEVREPWQPPEIVASESTSPVALPGTGVAQSPFAALALQPLDSTVVEIPARVYHGLLRPGHQRCSFHSESLNYHGLQLVSFFCHGHLRGRPARAPLVPALFGE